MTTATHTFHRSFDGTTYTVIDGRIVRCLPAFGSVPELWLVDGVAGAFPTFEAALEALS